MAKFIGPQFSFGIGKEATRGTSVTASYWMPWSSLTMDDDVKSAKDETSIGVIEQGVGSDITVVSSKGSFDGNIDDSGFGLILKSTMGSETATLVSGETIVYDHKFTVLESAQHPSLSVSVFGPNESTGRVYPLAMVDQLDLSFDLNKYANYKVSLTANQSAAQANTVSFGAAVNKLRPQDMTFSYGANIAGLPGTTVQIKKFALTIKKNVEDDVVLGTTTPVDRLNKEFIVSGSFELYYTDRSFIDTIMVADVYKAIEIVVANSNVTIGSVSHPTLTVRLAKVKLIEVARKFSDKAITLQTIKFEAFYSLGDSEMLDITLRNLVTTAY